MRFDYPNISSYQEKIYMWTCIYRWEFSEIYVLILVWIVVLVDFQLGAAMGDYYTLDDMFETSSANKESRGLKDEKAKKRAIAGFLFWNSIPYCKSSHMRIIELLAKGKGGNVIHFFSISN